MPPRKKSRTTNTTGASSSGRAPVARGKSSQPPRPDNVFGIEFVNAAQRSKFDEIVSRELSAPKFVDVEWMTNLGLWDDLRTLLSNLGLLELVTRRFGVYARLVYEFYSSFRLDANPSGDEDYFTAHFRLGNRTFVLSLSEFNDALGLPHHGLLTCRHNNYSSEAFWESISCESRPTFPLRNGRFRYFNPQKSKATFICNPIFRYLQRTLANSIFARHDSQNTVRSSELFLIWAALNKIPVNCGALLLEHIRDQLVTKSTCLATGGIATALAVRLGVGIDLSSLTLLHPGGLLNYDACMYMKLFVLQDNAFFVNHHGAALFRLPNPALTTITDERHWSYGHFAALGAEPGPTTSHAGPSEPSGHREEPNVGPSGYSEAQEAQQRAGVDIPLLTAPPTTETMFQSILDHLNRLQVGQDGLRDSMHQHRTETQHGFEQLDNRLAGVEHLVLHAYEQLHWPYPPPGWQPRGPPGPY